MTPKTQENLLQHPAQLTSRKEQVTGDAFSAWIDHYLDQAVLGVRSEAVAQKITLHLRKFLIFFLEQYGHEWLSTCVIRDVKAWQRAFNKEELVPAAINNYLASLSGFMTWVCDHAQTLFPVGNPICGLRELPLPALKPRSFPNAKVRSLKSFCDRLHRFQECRGQRWKGEGGVKASARPLRDRALAFLLLSTGDEVTQLSWAQLEPHGSDELKITRKARLTGVKGKRGTERKVFLSQDARLALADYLETERPCDVTEASMALFLSAASQ